MQYNVTVIGSGPGGYSAAIRAAQLGYKTAIIEKYSTLGGTCTNVGCIPSKALLDSTEHFYEATKKFETHGIEFEGLKLNFGQLINRKNDVVAKNTSGIQYLMSKNKIAVIEGTASFVSDNELRIAKNDGMQQTVRATYIIIATGSKPATIP